MSVCLYVCNFSVKTATVDAALVGVRDGKN
jgi:hypothetical protein